VHEFAAASADLAAVPAVLLPGRTSGVPMLVGGRFHPADGAGPEDLVAPGCSPVCPEWAWAHTGPAGRAVHGRTQPLSVSEPAIEVDVEAQIRRMVEEALAGGAVAPPVEIVVAAGPAAGVLIECPARSMC
jgi:hypothetical protein